jgi:hypothetical protein
VVLPWSTWAMIAMFRRSLVDRWAMGRGELPRGSTWGNAT